MFYKYLIRPILFKFSEKDPEIAHKKVLSWLKWIGKQEWLTKLIEDFLSVEDKRLEQEVFGLKFKNPVGLAAGFDKNAVALQGLQALGFGFLEVGTVTRFSQEGNSRPRIFRFSRDEALINRMGFDNDGVEVVVERLKQIRKLIKVPLGISLGKLNNTSLEKVVKDYCRCLKKLYKHGDYFVINVSSPNIPGLRELQEKRNLDILLDTLQREAKRVAKQMGISKKPILVKISPDLSWEAIDELLAVCIERRIFGLICVNTTVSRDGLTTLTTKEGGLSGRPLFNKAIRIVRYIHQNTQGKIPIIGVGGIFDAKDAYEMLKAGASLIQIFTCLLYEGPFIVRRINRGLLQKMERDGIKNLSELKKAVVKI